MNTRSSFASDTLALNAAESARASSRCSASCAFADSSDTRPPVYFQRRRVDGGRKVELRGDCPKVYADVLDAVSTARGQPRNELVNEIIGLWADQYLHEVTVLERVARGNPDFADVFPKRGD